ncbi:MAG TPA: PAS domain S-box protein [bacterium]|nr:PAS domain S-box protein [bacterium]
MRNGKIVRILFAEDSFEDAELTMVQLRRSGLDFESMRVDTEREFLAALSSFLPDIVVSDYMMPSFDGMRALFLARQFDPMLPFIVLTGSMNEDTAVACIKAGANDYVIKEHVTRLPFAIREALEHSVMKAKERQTDMLLRESEERYRSIFEESSAVMLIVDPETKAIIDANKSAVAFYGWPHDQLLSMTINDISTIDPERISLELRRAISKEKELFQFEHHRADGSAMQVEVHAGPISIRGKTYLFSVVHDISRRIIAERERDALASRLSHYLSTSPTITYSLRLIDGVPHWDWISENVADILGYSVDDVKSNDWWFGNVQALDRAQALKAIAQLIAKKTWSHEYRFYKKDRSLVSLRDTMRLVPREDGTVEIAGTLTDITEQKQAEAEIRLKSSALDAAFNAVVITDRNGDIKWVNASFERLTGFSIAEALGKNPGTLIRSGKQSQEFYTELWDTMLSGKVWSGELINKRKSGELYREEMTITPLMDSEGKVVHFIAIKNDVTEQALAKERLESALREKEILLREIHHRIKNNMQIISSLLYLSASDSTDPEFQKLVEAVSRRIETMAIVHEQFYESKDMSNIDFRQYLQQLVSSLIDQYGVEGIRPTLVFEADELMLSLELAIPVGLIISELVSNVLKYDFVAAKVKYILTVRLRSLKGDMLEIEVKDNGSIKALDTERHNPHTTGLKLIGILAEQIHGQISSSVDDGISVRVRFPSA